MEVLGAPDRYIIQKASRRELFFGELFAICQATGDVLTNDSDHTGAPRPFVSQKGKRRRPSSKSLAQILKCDDELFVDFIAKCLTWDPDKRLRPQAAMRHPWILAGRRRPAPVPGPSSVSASRSRSSNLIPTASSGSIRNSARAIADLAVGNGYSNGNGYGSSTSSSKEKKPLVISPPTPLMARANQTGSLTNNAPRLSQSISSTRIASQGIRNTVYVSCVEAFLFYITIDLS